MRGITVQLVQTGNMKYQTGTFIIVPNLHLLTGMDSQSQAIFMWLCKYANQQGECFPSIETLRKRTGLSRNTVLDRLERLEDKKLINKLPRHKQGGDKDTNLYQILIHEIEGGSSRDALPLVHGAHEGSAGDAHRTVSSELNPKQGIDDGKPSSPRKNWKQEDLMNLKEFVLWCKKSPSKHIQIIAEWAEAEGPTYTTYGQWSAYIRRYTKVARRLTPFTLEQIEKAYKKMMKDVQSEKNPRGFITKYSLETLEKYL